MLQGLLYTCCSCYCTHVAVAIVHMFHELLYTCYDSASVEETETYLEKDKHLDSNNDDEYKLYDRRSDDEDKHYVSESNNVGNQSDVNESGSETEYADRIPEYKLGGEIGQSNCYGRTDDEVEEDNNATSDNEEFMEDIYSEIKRIKEPKINKVVPKWMPRIVLSCDY